MGINWKYPNDNGESLRDILFSNDGGAIMQVKTESVFRVTITGNKQLKRAFKLWRLENNISCGTDLSETSTGIVALHSSKNKAAIKEFFRNEITK